MLRSLTPLLFVFSVLLSQLALADIESVEASISANPVMVDEAIRLTIVARGDANNDAFDSSPLMQDFVVGRTSVSSQTAIVNFSTSQTTTWTTTLFPRKEGTFVIPAFTIEGKQTQPIRVEVIPANNNRGEARKYYVTTEVNHTEAYLNQQLLYTVKLFLASNIERGSLQAPEMPNAEITQIGEDKQYTDIVNGQRYQIIERNFAVIPLSSGEFTIRGPVFNGEVMAANTNKRFGLFNQTEEISRVGPDITVTINPIPQGIDYDWLPSELVRIDEQWPQGENFIVGEPITRAITLTAVGITEAVLPEIPSFYPPHFKLYPDQSNTASVERDNTLIAQRQSSLAIIPTQAGSFVLPEITVPWFNTATGATEYATLPPRSVVVSPSSSLPTSNPIAAEPIMQDTEENAEQTTPSNTMPQSEPAPSYWIYIAVASFLLWIATLVVLLAVMKRTKTAALSSASQTPLNTPHNNLDEAEAFKQLVKCVQKNDVANAPLAVTAWLRHFSTRPAHHIRLSDFDETKYLQPAFDQFMGSKYGDSKSSSASDLLVQLKQARKSWHQKLKAQKGHTLSELYPS